LVLTRIGMGYFVYILQSEKDVSYRTLSGRLFPEPVQSCRHTGE